jgi:hypothetical protein
VVVEAGRGAQQQVERLEAEVEQARRRLAQAEQRLYAWRQGAEGERLTADVLRQLESAGWVVLHDLHWPGRPYANIDHIVVGPTGIYVIDSKNWSGRVDVHEGVLRQNGRRRTDECEDVVSAAAAVAAYLEPQHRSMVLGLLCLVGQPTPALQPATARVAGLNDLCTSLTTTPARLSPQEVTVIGGYLRGLLDGSRSPELKTTAALATAGAAPAEPRRPRGRSSTRRPAGRAPQRRRRGAGAPQRRRRGAGRDLVKLVVVALVALVLFPPFLHRLQDATSDPGTRTPAVQPTHTPPTGKPNATTTARSRAG